MWVASGPHSTLFAMSVRSHMLCLVTVLAEHFEIRRPLTAQPYIGLVMNGQIVLVASSMPAVLAAASCSLIGFSATCPPFRGVEIMLIGRIPFTKLSSTLLSLALSPVVVEAIELPDISARSSSSGLGTASVFCNDGTAVVFPLAHNGAPTSVSPAGQRKRPSRASRVVLASQPRGPKIQELVLCLISTTIYNNAALLARQTYERSFDMGRVLYSAGWGIEPQTMRCPTSTNRAWSVLHDARRCC